MLVVMTGRVFRVTGSKPLKRAQTYRIVLVVMIGQGVRVTGPYATEEGSDLPDERAKATRVLRRSSLSLLTTAVADASSFEDGTGRARSAPHRRQRQVLARLLRTGH